MICGKWWNLQSNKKKIQLLFCWINHKSRTTISLFEFKNMNERLKCLPCLFIVGDWLGFGRLSVELHSTHARLFSIQFFLCRPTAATLLLIWFVYIVYYMYIEYVRIIASSLHWKFHTFVTSHITYTHFSIAPSNLKRIRSTTWIFSF